MLFSRGSSWPRDRTQASRIASRFFTIWATREAQEYWSGSLSLLQGIFPAQELNQGLLHCRQLLYQLSYQRSPSGSLSMECQKNAGKRKRNNFFLFLSFLRWGNTFVVLMHGFSFHSVKIITTPGCLCQKRFFQNTLTKQGLTSLHIHSWIHELHWWRIDWVPTVCKASKTGD